MYTNPSVADFQALFVRDFPYGTDILTTILDSDITSAFCLVNINFNPCFWQDQGAYTRAYLLLAAHYLVLNIRNSSQGIVGQYNFNETSKSAGAVSQAFQIPQRIMDNPELSMLTKTNYGAMYLQLLLPQLCGQMFTVVGRTQA